MESVVSPQMHAQLSGPSGLTSCLTSWRVPSLHHPYTPCLYVHPNHFLGVNSISGFIQDAPNLASFITV